MAVAAPDLPDARRTDIPPFVIAAQVVAYLAFVVAWFRGGRVERFGTGVLLLDYLITGIAYSRWGGATGFIELASEGAVAVVLVWLALTSNRWWPFVAAAALILGALVVFLERVTHHLSNYASESAQIGLWMVVYLALLSGAGERWLAGEKPATLAAVWRPHARS